MSLVISLDLETTSTTDLPTCGAAVYFENPLTDVLCVAYHPVQAPELPDLWVRGQLAPAKIAHAINHGAKFSGWNVMFFDRLGWAEILVKRYGFPPIPDDNWLDSMHLAAWKGALKR